MSDLDLEDVLRADSASWHQQLEPPADLDAHLEQLRSRNANPKNDRRWLFPALAAAAVVGLIAVGLTLQRKPLNTPAPPGNSSPTATVTPTAAPSDLSPGERALALHVAHQEAEGFNPKHPGPIVPVHRWPEYVDSVSATVMTHDEALHYLDNSTSNVANLRVLVIQLRGRFASVVSAPYRSKHKSGMETVRGSIVDVVVSLAPAHYGETTDGQISRSHPLLPNATLLYSR